MNVDVPCRSCGASPLLPILSLGRTPLANSLRLAEEKGRPEERFPLDLAFCRECSLVQITESVPPEKLFSDYLYFSSFSDTMLRHVEALTSRLIAERALTDRSLVAEIASNDGYLLQNYAKRNIPVLGIEPAKNIAKVAIGRGIPTISEFFGSALAERLAAEGKRADIIHGHNVLAHVPDLNGVVGGLARLIKDDGVVVIEAPYLMDFVEKCEFDTIYHEHLCYFSLTALDALFARHGLTIFDAERTSIHGGSICIFAGRGRAQGKSVARLLDEEKKHGVRDHAYYAAFAERVAEIKRSLRGLLSNLKTSGARVAAYGAAAKGATLLNFSEVGTELLEYVVDRSPHKQGRFMPGVSLEVRAPAYLLADPKGRPDYLLILAWNFRDEIVRQQAEFAKQGGRFIVPIPEPRVIDV